VRDELERVEIRAEEDARERAWSVVREAFGEREPAPRPSHWPRVAAVAVALAALAAAAFSPPGQAVLDEIREVVGVERAQPALFSLPATGSLLVVSDAGLWVVHEDGSKRLLGDYREAGWSPFGRFVVAARANELAALEPDGKERWTLARPGVRSPRWTGTETDTRIAYVDRGGLRVVAGDGTGDRLLVPFRRFRGAIAWRPGAGFVLAIASARELRVVDVSTGRTLWRRATRPVESPTRLEWSSAGTRLFLLSTHLLRVYDARGRLVARTESAPGASTLAAAFRPGGSEVALVRVRGEESTVFGSTGSRFHGFNGTGVLTSVAWSPNGRWYLVTWITADQWVFVRAGPGVRRIRAVSNVSEQFRSQTFPQVQGWCCAR
jgi:hypothetical protein